MLVIGVTSGCQGDKRGEAGNLTETQRCAERRGVQ
jgi:hypothetical protein